MSAVAIDTQMLKETLVWIAILWAAVAAVVILWLLLEHAERWLRREPRDTANTTPRPEHAATAPATAAVWLTCSSCHKRVRQPVHTIEQVLRAIDGTSQCDECVVFFAAHESEVS